ncbi:hypothetical protein Pelo_8369 [Pelomyxa schiedti]|nr:hypothetical protein Pelo_8369 [Pelomyxa schiedti]
MSSVMAQTVTHTGSSTSAGGEIITSAAKQPTIVLYYHPFTVDTATQDEICQAVQTQLTGLVYWFDKCNGAYRVCLTENESTREGVSVQLKDGDIDFTPHEFVVPVILYSDAPREELLAAFSQFLGDTEYLVPLLIPGTDTSNGQYEAHFFKVNPLLVAYPGPCEYNANGTTIWWFFPTLWKYCSKCTLRTHPTELCPFTSEEEMRAAKRDIAKSVMRKTDTYFMGDHSTPVGLWLHQRDQHCVMLSLSSINTNEKRYELVETSCVGYKTYFAMSEGCWTLNHNGEIVCSGTLLYRAAGVRLTEEVIPSYSVRIHEGCFKEWVKSWCSYSFRGIPHTPSIWGSISRLCPYADAMSCSFEKLDPCGNWHITESQFQSKFAPCSYQSGRLYFDLTWHKYGLKVNRPALLTLLAGHLPNTGKSSPLWHVPPFLLIEIAMFIVHY